MARLRVKISPRTARMSASIAHNNVKRQWSARNLIQTVYINNAYNPRGALSRIPYCLDRASANKYRRFQSARNQNGQIISAICVRTNFTFMRPEWVCAAFCFSAGFQFFLYFQCHKCTVFICIITCWSKLMFEIDWGLQYSDLNYPAIQHNYVL